MNSCLAINTDGHIKYRWTHIESYRYYRYMYTYELVDTHIFPCSSQLKDHRSKNTEYKEAHTVPRSWFRISFFNEKNLGSLAK